MNGVICEAILVKIRITIFLLQKLKISSKIIYRLKNFLNISLHYIGGKIEEEISVTKQVINEES
jgi:hypothetical protein